MKPVLADKYLHHDDPTFKMLNVRLEPIMRHWGVHFGGAYDVPQPKSIRFYFTIFPREFSSKPRANK